MSNIDKMFVACPNNACRAAVPFSTEDFSACDFASLKCRNCGSEFMLYREVNYSYYIIVEPKRSKADVIETLTPSPASSSCTQSVSHGRQTSWINQA